MKELSNDDLDNVIGGVDPSTFYPHLDSKIEDSFNLSSGSVNPSGCTDSLRLDTDD